MATHFHCIVVCSIVERLYLFCHSHPLSPQRYWSFPSELIRLSTRAARSSIACNRTGKASLLLSMDWEASQEVGQADMLKWKWKLICETPWGRNLVYLHMLSLPKFWEKASAFAYYNWHSNWEFKHIVAPSWTKVCAKQNNMSWSGMNLQYLYRTVDSQTHNSLTCWLLISSAAFLDLQQGGFDIRHLTWSTMCFKDLLHLFCYELIHNHVSPVLCWCNSTEIM